VCPIVGVFFIYSLSVGDFFVIVSGGRVSFSDPENVPTVGLRRSSSVPSSTMRSQESQEEEEMRDNFPTLSVNTSPAYVSRPISIPEADDDDTEEESVRECYIHVIIGTYVHFIID
jgi:hypothetical protein